MKLIFRPGNGLNVSIGSTIYPTDNDEYIQTTIYPTENELPKFPQFIRFGQVNLLYGLAKLPNYEMCQSVVNYLQPLKSALNDSNMINFTGLICQDQDNQGCFTDHSKLLNHLQEGLMPICNSSRGYNFDIWFCTNKNTGSKVAAAILQMPAIGRCSTLKIILRPIQDPIQLPVEAISNWLHRRYDGTNENRKQLFLQIGAYNIGNIGDLYEHLKKVIIIYIQNFI